MLNKSVSFFFFPSLFPPFLPHPFFLSFVLFFPLQPDRGPLEGRDCILFINVFPHTCLTWSRHFINLWETKEWSNEWMNKPSLFMASGWLSIHTCTNSPVDQLWRPSDFRVSESQVFPQESIFPGMTQVLTSLKIPWFLLLGIWLLIPKMST